VPRSRPTRSRLERRRRASARIALYASLGTVGALVAALLAFLGRELPVDGSTAWAREDYASRPEVALLREYIAIDTSTPDGDQLAGAEWVAGRLEAMGLEPVVERIGDEANVWAVLEGRRPEAVVLHHHVDVDPIAHPELWTHDPFGGEIEGPWIYGRGAFDMKSVGVAQLEAVRALVESGRRPELSVLVLATTGEEVGSDLGTKWFLRAHPELVERFAVVLTEGGAVEGTRPGEVKYWGTETSQTRLVQVAICDASAEALRALERDLAREHGLEGEPRLVPEIAEFLAGYAPSRDSRRLRASLEDPRALVRDRRGLAGLSTYLRAFLVDRVIPKGVRRAPGGGFVLSINLLLLPGSDPAQVLAERLPDWLVHGFAVEVYDEGGASHGTPRKHWAFGVIDRVMRERYPDFVHGPLYLPSTVTDARFFRRAGVPTFGFTPFNVLTPEVLSIRQGATVEERIGLDGYLEGVDLYRELLDRLALTVPKNDVAR